jgi:DNA (cytosine-5)-methyltransferase 1
MNRPLLLDLFCGAGGAAAGYQRAGFEVIGVDNRPQPAYPFDFYQADALDALRYWKLDRFAAIHASPPCQAYSIMTRGYGTAGNFPDMLAATRSLLERTGRPWIIENVPGAPMRTDYKLCGCMFDLPQLRRQRWFETSWHGFELRPECQHEGYAVTVTGHPGRKWKNGPRTVLADCKRAMGIDWMNGDELSQAIPPAYTEHVGRALLEHLAAAA